MRNVSVLVAIGVGADGFRDVRLRPSGQLDRARVLRDLNAAANNRLAAALAREIRNPVRHEGSWYQTST